MNVQLYKPCKEDKEVSLLADFILAFSTPSTISGYGGGFETNGNEF